MGVQLVININQLSSSVFLIVCYYQLLYDNMTQYLSNMVLNCILRGILFMFMKITAIYEQKQ